MSDSNDPFIDITNERCPMTFVRVKLQLEAMESGETLTVRLTGGEPLVNVPRSLKEEHYSVSDPQADGLFFTFQVSKP